VSEPRESEHHGGPLVDDVDGRAAALMAQLAARQRGHAAPPNEPEPRPEPEVELDQIAEPEPEPLPDPEPLPEPEPAPDPEYAPEPTKRADRRMSLPPWQSQVVPASVGGASGGDRLPASTPPPGPWRPPPPPPGWNPPPPPPGWPGPPPWMPPTRDAVAAAPPPVRVTPPVAEVPRVWPAEVEEPVDAEQLTPQFGWRRMLHRVTAGRVNPGVSQRDRDQQSLLAQIRQPLGSDFRIAVLSIKGGVGKTTTTIGLGSAFAMVRSDRVVAVDANPDRGTLAERISDSSTSSTVRDLLLDDDVSRYADVRRHTRMAPSRLEVLASVQDPAVAEVFGENDYRRTIEILQAHYNIILTDCGTGIMHSSMASVLDLAHAVVLVSSPAVDAARSAAATLDWLTEHGYGRLAHESHVVLSGAGSRSAAFDEVFQYFEERSGSIHVVPFEPHLARGADVDFAMLSADAVRAYMELAGAVAAKFSRVG